MSACFRIEILKVWFVFAAFAFVALVQKSSMRTSFFPPEARLVRAFASNRVISGALRAPATREDGYDVS